MAARTLCRDGLLREFSNLHLISASVESFFLKKPSWIAKKFTLNLFKDLKCITTLEAIDSPTVIKSRLFPVETTVKWHLSEGGFDLHISFEIRDSILHASDMLIYELHKASYSRDFKVLSMYLLKEWYEVFSNLYVTGNSDPDGYPLFKGENFDLIIRNFIRCSDGTIKPFDIEWVAEELILADFILCLCAVADILMIVKKFSIIKYLRKC